MIPGLPAEMLSGSDEEGSLRLKRMIFITDSMTAAELDSDGSVFMDFGKDGKPTGLTWRVTRVAKGSGTSVREVEELLCQYRLMANMAKQAGGKNGWYGLSLPFLHRFFTKCQIKVTGNAENASRGRRTWAWRKWHANSRTNTSNAGTFQIYLYFLK
jgi:hypothetical protein